MNIRQKLSGWRREGRGWPHYLPGGRIRTSTAGLIVTFIVLSWVSQVYEPPAQPAAPESAIVPPGFVPDPNYTWVPRTNVRPRETEYPTTTTPTTTTTTTPEPTPTTSPTEPTTSPGETPTTTAPGDPFAPPTTTMIDPDGAGPQGPQTFTQAPDATPTVTGPVPPPAVPPQ